MQSDRDRDESGRRDATQGTQQTSSNGAQRNSDPQAALVTALRELQEDTDKQLNEIGRMRQRQNEKFDKEIENVKRSQTEILEPEEYNDGLKEVYEEMQLSHWKCDLIQSYL